MPDQKMPALLLITDRQQARAALPAVVEAALAAGCRWVSVREKDLPKSEQTRLAADLLPLVRRYGARLSLHGDPALARSLDGVHLAAGSDAVAARRLLGPDKLVGLSVHTATEAAAVDPALVDYVIAGPVYDSASKPGYGPALGTEGLTALVRVARVPVLAIGGIVAARVADVMAAGAAGIAVMGGVMRAPDPAGEVRALLAVLVSA
jgi:thiamine-phosphate pyrophosphorylase